jgi:NADPH-dependent ferric siderophore reductase
MTTSTPPPRDTASLVARLGDGVAAYDLELLARRQLSPTMVAVSLGGALHSFEPLPGNDLMIDIPDDTGAPFRRRYTIRSIDRAANTLELWIHTASGGPGSRWALDAPIGSHVEAIGPRGKVVLAEVADWHLFAGDLSFLPAAYAMGEAIDPPGQAIFLFEIDDEADALTPSLDEMVGVTVGFIERGTRAHNDPTGLLRGFESLELPDDLGHYYLGGELKVVNALKTAIRERGVDDASIAAKPYWRQGVANLPHGEPDKS